MRKLHLKSVMTGALLALCCPVMAEECVMHVHTVKGETLDVAVPDSVSASWYGNTEKYQGSVFYAYTGYMDVDEDGRAIPLVVDGEVRGSILCEIPMINISEITFSLPSGVKSVSSDALGISVFEGIMRISRVTEPVRVYITSVSGVVEYDRVVESDTEIDLNCFGSGVHAVAAGSLNFKILVK